VKHLKKLEDEISTWPHASVSPHRYGGKEFSFGRAEIGHVHANGIVDIPFPRPVRDALLAEGLAEEHRWVPDSGWITFHIRRDQDVTHASWLMRLSYLRYALKGDSDPRKFLERETEALHLSPSLKPLLERFLPSNATDVAPELLPAETHR
jgi:hypothetical protein